jgi:hypothetical protein
MKVLYVACNADINKPLLLERDINEIQKRVGYLTLNEVEFVFLPHIYLEDLPSAISKYKPTILHIAAHGNNSGISLANSSNNPVFISGEHLKAFIDDECPPYIVYISACNSSEIAKIISEIVPICIGTSAPITNRAARSAAINFYDRLINGGSIQSAFQVGKAILEAESDSTKATSLMYYRDEVDPLNTRLVQTPKIVARFSKEKYKPNNDGFYNFDLGIVGCPKTLIQVVFFTDDQSFICEDSDEEVALCLVVRDTPVRQTIWSDDNWTSYADFRLYASCVTADGKIVSISSTLCEGLDLWYRRFNPASRGKPLLEPIEVALKKLKQYDGAGF